MNTLIVEPRALECYKTVFMSVVKAMAGKVKNRPTVEQLMPNTPNVGLQVAVLHDLFEDEEQFNNYYYEYN